MKVSLRMSLEDHLDEANRHGNPTLLVEGLSPAQETQDHIKR